MARLLLLLAVPPLIVACGSDAPENPIEAQQTYGAPVDATDAIPVPAAAAEQDRYLGRRVTIDGRIIRIRSDGCALTLDTGDNAPLRVEASRIPDDGCAWQIPAETRGFAVAVGSLRVERDTLHLTANGVQVTPVGLQK